MNQLDQLTRQLQPVVTALQTALGDNLIALILFGSRARGDAHPDSDWDLLLIAHNLPHSTWKRQQQLAAMLPPSWRYQVNMLAHTSAEWLSRVTPLALDIALDGILLYDNSQNLILAHLMALRQQLAQLGLERHASGNEWIWLWRDKPPRHWKLEWML